MIARRSGPVTGAVTGPVTGAVTGAVTEAVTGAVTRVVTGGAVPSLGEATEAEGSRRLIYENPLGAAETVRQKRSYRPEQARTDR
jgi:hypothetical protein